MTRWEAPQIDIPTTHEDDPRFGHLLAAGTSDPSEADVIIAGFPSDEGVKRNGGRPGAASAPDEIRRRLYRLTPNPTNLQAWEELLSSTVDLGNLKVDPAKLEHNQQLFGQELSPYVARNAFIIILGGGHETAFAHFRAYAEVLQRVRILNIDAHLDVRPLENNKPHSGSPFRQAFEHPSNCCKSYTVLGALPHSVAANHADYIKRSGGNISWRADVDTALIEGTFRNLDGPAMVTLDMDAVDQSLAPGVSAPATGGLLQHEWLAAAFAAGKCLHVTSVDICEVNPRLDIDGQTASFAATTVWQVLDGLCQRVLTQE